MHYHYGSHPDVLADMREHIIQNYDFKPQGESSIVNGACMITFRPDDNLNPLGFSHPLEQEVLVELTRWGIDGADRLDDALKTLGIPKKANAV